MTELIDRYYEKENDGVVETPRTHYKYGDWSIVNFGKTVNPKSLAFKGWEALRYTSEGEDKVQKLTLGALLVAIDRNN